MKQTIIGIMIFSIMLIFVQCQTGENSEGTQDGDIQGFVVDHLCTDLSNIPDEWIARVKENLNVHYAHTSHGSQISIGLGLLANDNSHFGFVSADCQIPVSTAGISMMEGQYISGDSYCETYITPDLYWESDYGLNMTRWMLNNHQIHVSLWAWCSQADYYSESEVNNYLNRISQLEEEFPEVIFIYMTGNAQSTDQNRYQRNNQIREYCRNNGKILFDFADLDCWYNGEQHLEDGIPVEHPQYHGDQAGHTTYESCRNKARAFWWLLARLSGWDGT
jgi:hypothetical protein